MKTLADYGIEPNNIYMFLKFSEEKHLESLREGNLHMKNLKYYIEREEKEGDKGVGDRYEGTQVVNNFDFELRNPETDEVLLGGKSREMKLRADESLRKPVFCMTGVNSKMLKVINETDDYVETVISSTEEENKKMEDEFGEYVMVMSPEPLMNAIISKFSENNYSYKADFVRYDDYKINNSARLEDFHNLNPNFYFWKEQSFKHQNEYRIVILNEDTESFINLNIGKLKGFSKILKSKDLFEGKLTLRFNKTSPTS